MSAQSSRLAWLLAMLAVQARETILRVARVRVLQGALVRRKPPARLFHGTIALNETIDGI